MITPSVTIIFMAASTLMSSSIASERGSSTMKPEVGFGVVGMKTQICGSGPCTADNRTSEAV